MSDLARHSQGLGRKPARLLDALLREQGVDSLVVTGLTTSGCVRATAVDGLQCDYRVVVPARRWVTVTRKHTLPTCLT